MWEECHSLTLPLLVEGFAPDLIEDNGDSLVVTRRRETSEPTFSARMRGELSLPSRVSETPWSRSASPTPSNSPPRVSLCSHATGSPHSRTCRTHLGISWAPSHTRHSPSNRSPHRSSKPPRLSIPRYPRSADHSHALELSPRPTACSTHKRRLLHHGARRRPQEGAPPCSNGTLSLSNAFCAAR